LSEEKGGKDSSLALVSLLWRSASWPRGDDEVGLAKARAAELTARAAQRAALQSWSSANNRCSKLHIMTDTPPNGHECGWGRERQTKGDAWEAVRGSAGVGAGAPVEVLHALGQRVQVPLGEEPAVGPGAGGIGRRGGRRGAPPTPPARTYQKTVRRSPPISLHQKETHGFGGSAECRMVRDQMFRPQTLHKQLPSRVRVRPVRGSRTSSAGCGGPVSSTPSPCTATTFAVGDPPLLSSSSAASNRRRAGSAGRHVRLPTLK